MKEAVVNTAPPTLASIMKGILESGEQRNRYGQICNLKAAARVFDFLQENNISTLPELREKVSEMHERFEEVRENSQSFLQLTVPS